MLWGCLCRREVAQNSCLPPCPGAEVHQPPLIPDREVPPWSALAGAAWWVAAASTGGVTTDFLGDTLHFQGSFAPW